MSTIVEVEKLAFELTEEERAALVVNLLHSLPPIMFDDDEGFTEALRRDGEIQQDPSQAMSLEDLHSMIKGRQR